MRSFLQHTYHPPLPTTRLQPHMEQQIDTECPTTTWRNQGKWRCIPHILAAIHHVPGRLLRASHAFGLSPIHTPRPDTWPSSYAGHAPAHPSHCTPRPATPFTRLSRVWSAPLPPSRMPCPCPDARPSSYAGHAPGHPHVMLPCPAALICKPCTCPSLMPCPRARLHSFAGHLPSHPHATPPCLAVLVCRSCAYPSLMPHPHSRLPSFACYAPAHRLCHTPMPRQPGSL